jgi:hypothetical protein
LIDTGDGARQPRVVGPGPDSKFFHVPDDGAGELPPQGGQCHIEAVMTDLKTLYEQDLAAWSRQQTEALRAAGRGGSNQPLDWENLAEEIEDLAKSLRRRLRSQIARIIHHQVKLEYSPAIEPRNGWRRTIRLARLDIARILEDSPSLKREIPRLIEKETAGAVQFAIVDLEEHSEIDQMELPTIKNTTYTEEQVLGDWFPEERRG